MEMDNRIWTISREERDLALRCMDMILARGASQVRITLSKSMMDLVSVLNGQTDKVTHSGDRAMAFNIFAGGRYGTFSTNRLESAALQDFIGKALDTVKTLAPDEFRKLPSPERKAKDAVTGLEAGLFDGDGYAGTDAAGRIDTAMAAAGWGKLPGEGFRPVSEEMEYSDSVYDTYLIDSEGLECRHTETSFEIGCETTVEGPDGNKSSGYWWDSSPRFGELDRANCCRKAMERAAAQIGAEPAEGGKYAMVVENETASRLLSPVLNALNAFSIQQNNSFMDGSLGKRLFPEGFTVMDMPRVEGAFGARFFDSEGVATRNTPIIGDGEVKEYFINTYMAGKTGMAPTIEDSTRACIMPFGIEPGKNIGAAELMGMAGNGIFVTGLNGGNCNSATGDFSYGVEGFLFQGGKPVRPVREMLITGNMTELWKSLRAAGTDMRKCMSRGIPSLFFEGVDFSA